MTRPIISITVLALLALGPAQSAPAQQPRDSSILKAIYFASFRELYQGEYKRALRGFQEAGRSAIQTPDSRWIDSICYHTMTGEVHLRTGQLSDARLHFDSALRLYLQFSDWMLRVQFPDAIGPDANVRQPPPWGASQRRARRGRIPDTFSMLRGGRRVVAVNGKAGIANVQQLHSLHVDELVRCTALAMRRRAELLGPAARHDRMTQEVLNKASARPGPPNHWSEVWIDLQLGMAYAAAGKKEQAAASLQRSLLAGGEFDHPLTCVAMLELGRLAIDGANYKEAARWLTEASISAYYFDRPEVIHEALHLGQLAHLMSGPREVDAPLIRAAAWANSRRLREIYAALLILTAEDYALLGDLKRAQSTLSLAGRNVGRGDMQRGAIGAQLNYVTAMIEALRENQQASDASLAAAMEYQRTGSIRLYQITVADTAYVKGNVRERVATDLYGQVLGDPSPIQWRHEPLESLTRLLLPSIVPLEHWFDAAMQREDAMLALNVADQVRRTRFFAQLPMGGRLLNLRWLLDAPAEALTPEALLQRNDLVARYPGYLRIKEEVNKTIKQLREGPLLPKDTAQARERSRIHDQLARLSDEEEKEIRKMALRREPADLVFPPRHQAKDLQERLGPGQAVLVFYQTRRQQHAFLLTQQRYGHWKVAEPDAVAEKLAALLRAMGHHDQGRELEIRKLADSSWQPASTELLAEILRGSNIDLGQGIDQLAIVPDGIYWYVPFEALHTTSQAGSQPLIAQTRVRYAPTLGLTVPDGRGRRQGGEFAIVMGRLFPREDPEIGHATAEQIRRVVPRAHPIDGPLLVPGHTLASLLDGLIVLDDIEPADGGPLAAAPLQVDKGRPGSTVGQWLGLPWGSPELVALPGLHTPAESSLKRLDASQAPGDELFTTSMGLLAAGSRTLLLSRWRTGGRTAGGLIGELVQEFQATSADDAWQRSVQIAHETPVDPSLEPRVAGTDQATEITAEHPFLWSGYLLIDTGFDPQPAKPQPRPQPADLKFPKQPPG